MYGQTEAAPRISYIKNEQIIKNIGSVGKTIPGGNISIVNKNQEGVGEIVYSGPNVFCGYFKNKDDYKSCRSIKILNTNDLGYFKNKNLYIVGRKSRDEKFFGIRINLDVMEENFKKFKIKVVKKENKLLIFIKKNKSKYSNYIKNLIISDYGLSTNAIKIIILGKIPFLPNNKVDYSKLIRRY